MIPTVVPFISNKPMKPLIKIAALSAVVAVSILSIGFGVKMMHSSMDDRLAHTFAYLKPAQTISTQQPVVMSMRKLNRYVTATYYEEVLKKAEKQHTFMTNDQLLMIYKVTVEAGFDLSQFSESNIETPTDSTVILTLPKAQLLPQRSKPSDKQVFKDSNKWTFAEENELHSQAMQEARENALHEGILERAEQNCRKYMSQLLVAFGYQKDNVTVRFK